jgi:hypothetical protein
MTIYGRQIDTLIHCRDSFPIVICYYEKEVETVMVRNHTNINKAINHILKSLNKKKDTRKYGVENSGLGLDRNNIWRCLTG